MSPETLAETVRIAVQRERERCADVIYTYDFRLYPQDDQGFNQFRQDAGDAILGKFRTPIVEHKSGAA